MSASTTSPMCSRPGRSRWPGFSRQKVTVQHARGAAPRMAPVPPWTPDGTSTATTGRLPLEQMLDDGQGAPVSGRSRPAPKSASTTSSAPSKPSTATGSTGPSQLEAAQAASPLSRSGPTSAASRTGQPAAAQPPGDDEPVAAIVARPAEDQGRLRREASGDGAGDRPAGVLHQPGAGMAGRDRRPVDRRHRDRGEKDAVAHATRCRAIAPRSIAAATSRSTLSRWRISSSRRSSASSGRPSAAATSQATA